MILGERGYSKVGVNLNLDNLNSIETLFSENGGYVIETKKLAECETVLNQYNCFYRYIGKTVANPELTITTSEQAHRFDIATFEKQYNSANA